MLFVSFLRFLFLFLATFISACLFVGVKRRQTKAKLPKTRRKKLAKTCDTLDSTQSKSNVQRWQKECNSRSNTIHGISFSPYFQSEMRKTLHLNTRQTNTTTTKRENSKNSKRWQISAKLSWCDEQYAFFFCFDYFLICHFSALRSSFSERQQQSRQNDKTKAKRKEKKKKKNQNGNVHSQLLDNDKIASMKLNRNSVAWKRRAEYGKGSSAQHERQQRKSSTRFDIKFSLVSLNRISMNAFVVVGLFICRTRYCTR